MELEKIFDGSSWCIYYLKIEEFVPDLQILGEALEKLSKEGRITSIIPNVGFTKSTIITGLEGVKGFAIILEKKHPSNSQYFYVNY